MCGGSEVGSYLELIDFVYYSTLGLKVIKRERSPKLLSAQGASQIGPFSLFRRGGTPIAFVAAVSPSPLSLVHSVA